jgi:hypothetical protein
MDKQSKIIVLGESYPIDYLLYKLENEKPEVPLTVFITALEGMYRLFQAINEKVYNNSLELIYYPTYVARNKRAKGIKKWLFTPGDILRERRHLKRFYTKYFDRLEGATVIFPSPGFTGVKIFVLRRLSKKNRLVYLDPGPPYMGRRTPRNPREIASLLMYKMLYGKETQLGQYPAVNPWTKGFPLMPEKFMKNNVVNSIDWSNRVEIMKDFDWDKYRIYDTSHIRVIYFHQDLVGPYVSDPDTFKQEISKVFDLLCRYFPEKEIAYKYHPGQDRNNDVMKVGEELPAYIPAQFLRSDNVQIYLGIFSSAIFDISGGQAISLIDLISFTDNDVKKRIKETMINLSRSEILCPKTLADFEDMLKNVVK